MSGLPPSYYPPPGFYPPPGKYLPPEQWQHGGGYAVSSGSSYGRPPLSAPGTPVPGRLFVNGLAQETTTADLRDYFQDFGELDDVYILRSGTGAFLTFADAACAQRVLASSVEHFVKPGLAVTVEQARPKTAEGGRRAGDGLAVTVEQGYGGVPPAAESSSAPWMRPRGASSSSMGVPQGPGRDVPGRLFLKGLAQETTKSDLRDYFEGFGELDDVYIPGSGKGIAFLTFADAACTQRVLASVEHVVKPGLAVTVEKAKPKPGDAGKAEGYGCVPPAPAAPQGPGTPVPGRLFLTRVDQRITAADLKDYFQEFGELGEVCIPGNGKPIAFVSFADAACAQRVLASAEHFVKPGLRVNVDQAMDRPKGAKGHGKGGSYESEEQGQVRAWYRARADYENRKRSQDDGEGGGVQKKTKRQIKQERQNDQTMRTMQNMELDVLLSQLDELSEREVRSRFLQQKLEDGHESDRDLIFDAVFQHAESLAICEFGFLLVRKMLYAGSEEQTEALAWILTGVPGDPESPAKQMMCHQYGHYVIKAMLRTVVGEAADALRDILNDATTKLKSDRYGVKLLDLL